MKFLGEECFSSIPKSVKSVVCLGRDVTKKARIVNFHKINYLEEDMKIA